MLSLPTNTIHRTTEVFREMLDKLPENIQIESRRRFRNLKRNPLDNEVKAKRLNTTKDLWSARASSRLDGGYRAIGKEGITEDGNFQITWGWIGPHSEYSKIIKRSRK